MVKTGNQRKADVSGVYKLSPNEEARMIREDRDKRRKQRIVQVREQARQNAAVIRKDVKAEKQRQLTKLAGKVENELGGVQAEKLKRLETNYDNCLRAIGQGHQSAEQQPSLEDQKLAALEVDDERAEVRSWAAMEKLRRDACVQNAEKTRLIRARTAALETEKKRAALVAALPPPPPDPLVDILPAKKERPVGVTDVAAFSSTHYHVPKDTHVAREAPTAQTAQEAAANEAARQREEALRKSRLASERTERARIRHIVAREKESLKHDYNAMLHDLSDLQREDRRRRQKVIEKIPRQVFVPPHKKAIDREERKRDIEHEFEDLYMKATDQVGDLSMALETHSGVPTPSGALDLSVVDAPGQTSKENVEEETASKTGVLSDISRNKKTDGVLMKLMDKIKTQRDEWASADDEASQARTSSPIGSSVSDKENHQPLATANPVVGHDNEPRGVTGVGYPITRDARATGSDSDQLDERRTAHSLSPDSSHDTHESQMDAIRRQQQEILARKKLLEERFLAMESQSPRRQKMFTSTNRSMDNSRVEAGEDVTKFAESFTLNKPDQSGEKSPDGRSSLKDEVSALDSQRVKDYQKSLLDKQTENWKNFADTRAQIEERRKLLVSRFPGVDIPKFGQSVVTSPLKRNILGIASHSTATSAATSDSVVASRLGEGRKLESEYSRGAISVSTKESDMLHRHVNGPVPSLGLKDSSVVSAPVVGGCQSKEVNMDVRKHLSFSDDDDSDESDDRTIPCMSRGGDLSSKKVVNSSLSSGSLPEERHRDFAALKEAAAEKRLYFESRQIELENKLRAIREMQAGVNSGDVPPVVTVMHDGVDPRQTTGAAQRGTSVQKKYSPVTEKFVIDLRRSDLTIREQDHTDLTVRENGTSPPSLTRDSFLVDTKPNGGIFPTQTAMSSDQTKNFKEGRVFVGRGEEVTVSGSFGKNGGPEDAFRVNTSVAKGDDYDRPPVNMSLYRINNHIPHELSFIEERDSAGTLRLSSQSAQIRNSRSSNVASPSEVLSEGPLDARDWEHNAYDDDIVDIPHVDGLTIKRSFATSGSRVGSMNCDPIINTRPTIIRPADAFSRTDLMGSAVLHQAVDTRAALGQTGESGPHKVCETPSVARQLFADVDSHEPFPSGGTLLSQTSSSGTSSTEISEYPLPLSRRLATSSWNDASQQSWVSPLRLPSTQSLTRGGNDVLRSPNRSVKERPYEKQINDDNKCLDENNQNFASDSQLRDIPSIESVNSSKFRSLDIRSDDSTTSRSAASGMSEKNETPQTALLPQDDNKEGSLKDQSLSDYSLKSESGNRDVHNVSQESRNWAEILRSDCRGHPKDKPGQDSQISSSRSDAKISPTSGSIHLGISPAYHRHLETYSPAKIHRDKLLSTPDYQPYIHEDPANRSIAKTPKKSAYEPVFVGMSPSYRSYLATSSPAKLQNDEILSTKVDHQPYLTSDPANRQSPVAGPQSERVHIGVSPLYKSHRSSPRRPRNEKLFHKTPTSPSTKERCVNAQKPDNAKISRNDTPKSALSSSTLSQHSLKPSPFTDSTSYYSLPEDTSASREGNRGVSVDSGLSSKALHWQSALPCSDKNFVWTNTDKLRPTSQNAAAGVKSSAGGRSFKQPSCNQTPTKQGLSSSSSLKAGMRTPRTARSTTSRLYHSPQTKQTRTPSKQTDWVSSLRSSPCHTPRKTPRPNTPKHNTPGKNLSQYSSTLAKMSKNGLANMMEKINAQSKLRVKTDIGIFDEYRNEAGISDEPDLTLVSFRSDTSVMENARASPDVATARNTNQNNRAGHVDQVTEPRETGGCDVDLLKQPERPDQAADENRDDDAALDLGTSRRAVTKDQTGGCPERRATPPSSYQGDADERSNAEEEDLSESLVSFMQHEVSVLKRRSDALDSNEPASLQDAFLAKKSQFIKKSTRRVSAIKDNANKIASTVTSWKNNRKMKGVVSMKMPRRSIATPTRDKDKSARKQEVRDNKERNKRLYSQLEEVKKRNEAAERVKEYASNREKAREYHKKMQEKRRKQALKTKHPGQEGKL